MDEIEGQKNDWLSASNALQALHLAVRVQEQLAGDSVRQAARIHWLHNVLEEILKQGPLSEKHGSCQCLVTSQASNASSDHQETIRTTNSRRTQVCQTHMNVTTSPTPEMSAAMQQDGLKPLVPLDEPPCLGLLSFEHIPQGTEDRGATASSSIDQSITCSSKDVPTDVVQSSGNMSLDAHPPKGKADATLATDSAVNCKRLPTAPAVATSPVFTIPIDGANWRQLLGRSSVSLAPSIGESDDVMQKRDEAKGDLEIWDKGNSVLRSVNAAEATAVNQLWPAGHRVDAQTQCDEFLLDSVAKDRAHDVLSSSRGFSAANASLNFRPHVGSGSIRVTDPLSSVETMPSRPSSSNADSSSLSRCKVIPRLEAREFCSEGSHTSTASDPANLSPSLNPTDMSTIKETSGLQQSSDMRKTRSEPLTRKACVGSRGGQFGTHSDVARKPKKDMASLERQLAQQLYQDMGMTLKVKEMQRHSSSRHSSSRHFGLPSGRPSLMQPSRVEPEVVPSGTNEKGPRDNNECAERHAEKLADSGHTVMKADDAATDAAEFLVEPAANPAGIGTKVTAESPAVTSSMLPPFLLGSHSGDKSSQLAITDGPPPAGCMRRRVPSMSHVHGMHQQTLIKEMCCELEEGMMVTVSDGSESFCWCASIRIWKFAHDAILRSCGVLPWSPVDYPLMSWVYQCFVLLLVLTLTGIHFWNLALKDHDSIMILELSMDIVLAMGCAFSLVACGALWRSTLMAEAAGLLENYTRQHDLRSQVEDSCLWDMLMGLGFWLLALGLRVAVHTLVNTGRIVETRLWANFILFTISSGILTGLVSFSLYLCRCMMIMVDGFSLTMNNHQQFGASLQDWNLLQSLHRNACKALQMPFMVMQTMALVVCILVIQEGNTLERDRLLAMGPGLLVALAIFRICIYAGVLTDKCTRLPVLISGLGLKSKNGEGLNLNWERLYAVNFISTNQGGFFIFEIRVTSAMVCKSAYLVGAGAFALLSSQK